MDIHFHNIQIRNALPSDAEQLCVWWNDGTVMAHTGFPNGLKIIVEKVMEELRNNNDMNRLCIILHENEPIGEMNYRIAKESHVAEIGIKICNTTKQNHGLGKVILSLFIRELFYEYGVFKITLEPNLKNTRA